MSAIGTYSPVVHPHRWLPRSVKFLVWQDIEPHYRALLDRTIESAKALEEWLLDAGELNAAVHQERDRRYIAMTCQTDDPEREAAHLAFVRDIEPQLKVMQNEIRARYLDSPHRDELDTDRYEVFNRAQANRRALFREENLARETELAELEQQYQKTIGAMTVSFRGEERTLAQMSVHLEETDRALRQEVWELTTRRRLIDRDRLDELFDQMVSLRTEIARTAGFESFTDFAYKSRERFDYGVPEVERFRDAIEGEVVPIVRKLHQERKAKLGVDHLRPWDLSVDPQGRPPLRPFQETEALVKGTNRIYQQIDPEFAAQFHFLHQQGLLDLANRKGKAPGGYQTTLEDDRLPFIFMNAVGVDGDIRTLLHEGGHAFHALAARDQELPAYREAPIEFCEVASMTMELFGGLDLSEFYAPEDAQRSYQELLEGVVTVLPWIATVDGFQHWVYAHPGHTREQRRAAWNDLVSRFGGEVDWTGYEDVRANAWHRQLHIFLYPFYYIEYGIAQLGALQLWTRWLSDRAGAVSAYKQGLALGGSRPLPELFKASGIPFAFDRATLRPLMAKVAEQLKFD